MSFFTLHGALKRERRLLLTCVNILFVSLVLPKNVYTWCCLAGFLCGTYCFLLLIKAFQAVL